MVSFTIKLKIMKNVFRLGFLAFAMAISLTACDFFGNSKNPKASTAPDTLAVDTTKIDTAKKELNKINPDTAALKQ